jgi:hypothetical protein
MNLTAQKWPNSSRTKPDHPRLPCYKFSKGVDTRHKAGHDVEYDEAQAATSAAM